MRTSRRGATCAACASRSGSKPGCAGSSSVRATAGRGPSGSSEAPRSGSRTPQLKRAAPTAPTRASVETRDELERGLRRLSVEQRAVLVLTYYLDLPQDEAASALGVPLGTLKSRSNRAMRALRAALEADAREPRFAQEPVR